ncbi:hypothetical protein ES703_42377 [subsurface metagenome]
MSKKLIFIIIILVIVVFIVYQGLFKEKEPEFTLAEVVHGNISQEVSETGQVQMGKEINLSFKNTGTIQAIFVEVGDKVWLGSSLARLNTSQLVIERNKAQASLEVAQAKLNQLLEGSTPEEIQAAQTDVNNAQIALENAQQDYEEDLTQAYEDALNVLANAYLKSSGTLTTVTSLRKSYFASTDQGSLTVNEREGNIDSLVSTAKTHIDQAQTSLMHEDIDTALSIMKDNLGDIYNDLNIIQDIVESSDYADTVSAADKTSLNTERLNINTALTNVINSQQTITSTRIDGETAVNNAEGNLKEAQDDLALQIAEPSQADIDLYQAQVKQAQAELDLLDNKIWESTIRSPVQGQVIKINNEVGETVQPSLSESVITLLPTSPYEIEVDIYEEDIVKMALGNEVAIFLIALPDQVFQGKVININPAEELVEGVVYYTVTISFEEVPQNIRPGMTADLVIKTDSRENVLIVPEDAIQKKDGKNMVQVFKDNQIEEREIEIGLMGSDDMVEVIAGLTEGEKVIVE